MGVVVSVSIVKMQTFIICVLAVAIAAIAAAQLWTILLYRAAQHRCDVIAAQQRRCVSKEFVESYVNLVTGRDAERPPSEPVTVE